MTPFVEGYIAALRQELGSDAPLADETLARILGECERFRGRTSSKCAKVGALFWKNRAAGYLSDDGWEALTPYLGDGGLIYLREAS